MADEDRTYNSKKMLYSIMHKHGVIYTLGLCMGILSRLTKYDLLLYKELKARYIKLMESDNK